MGTLTISLAITLPNNWGKGNGEMFGAQIWVLCTEDAGVYGTTQCPGEAWKRRPCGADPLHPGSQLVEGICQGQILPCA